MSDFVRKIQEAEGIAKRNQYSPEPKRDWKDAECLKCGYKIKYIPTERFESRLQCPECDEIFEVKSEEEKSKSLKLDDFIQYFYSVT